MLSLNHIVDAGEMAESPDLLARAQAGDAAAFSELCRVYETRLLRHAATLCANATQAEDLVQETLIEAWRCLHRYNGRCRFFTWLCAILLNRHRNSLRARRFLSFSFFTRPEQDELEDPVENLAAPEATPDQAAEADELAALVRKCVQALPPKHQQVIYLRFCVDHSLESIAAALGCSVGTVKSRLFHALDKLRAMRDLRHRAPILKGPFGTYETVCEKPEADRLAHARQP